MRREKKKKEEYNDGDDDDNDCDDYNLLKSLPLTNPVSTKLFYRSISTSHWPKDRHTSRLLPTLYISGTLNQFTPHFENPSL